MIYCIQYEVFIYRFFTKTKGIKMKNNMKTFGIGFLGGIVGSVVGIWITLYSSFLITRPPNVREMIESHMGDAVDDLREDIRKNRKDIKFFHYSNKNVESKPKVPDVIEDDFRAEPTKPKSEQKEVIEDDDFK